MCSLNAFRALFSRGRSLVSQLQDRGRRTHAVKLRALSFNSSHAVPVPASFRAGLGRASSCRQVNQNNVELGARNEDEYERTTDTSTNEYGQRMSTLNKQQKGLDKTYNEQRARVWKSSAADRPPLRLAASESVHSGFNRDLALKKRGSQETSTTQLSLP